MSLLNALSAQREVFLICPDSGDIIRLSECVIEIPGKIPASPADKITKLREKLDADERKLDEKFNAEREKRAGLGRRAAIKQVGEVYPFIDPRKINPADVQVLFDPVLLVAFHGASDEEPDVDVEFIAKQPESEPEELRVETLKLAVKTVAFKIYRVNLESGSVEVSSPKEYKPRSKKS